MTRIGAGAELRSPFKQVRRTRTHGSDISCAIFEIRGSWILGRCCAPSNSRDESGPVVVAGTIRTCRLHVSRSNFGLACSTLDERGDTPVGRGSNDSWSKIVPFTS